jgi:hypothetical protein
MQMVNPLILLMVAWGIAFCLFVVAPNRQHMRAETFERNCESFSSIKGSFSRYILEGDFTFCRCTHQAHPHYCGLYCKHIMIVNDVHDDHK